MSETDWNKIFRENLKSIWKELKELAESNIDKDLINKRLKSIADDFFQIFQGKDSPIKVEKDDYFYLNLFSVSIPLGSFSFLVPHVFYNLSQLNPQPNLNPLFAMPVSWDTFLSYFYETILNVRKPLKESDVKIMSILTRYRPKVSDKAIPFSLIDISKLVGSIGKRKKTISENTIGKRIMYLYSENILQDKFLINPWAVGYALQALVYNKNYDVEMKNWDKWTKYKQSFLSDNILRIIRLPQHAEGEFLFPSYVKSHEITENWYSNNISQLHAKESDSFAISPNFEVLKTSDYIFTTFYKKDDVKWIDKLLGMVYSTKTRKEEQFGSLNKIAENKRLEKALKFLSFISKEQRIRGPISKTAKRADLEEINFLDFMRFFVDQQIINFVTHTAYIGCNYRIGVMITSLKAPIKKQPRLQLFLQNLLELPLIMNFIGEYIICTYIHLPLKWVGIFTTYLNMLMTSPDLQIEFGTHMALQSYVRWNTPFSQDTILTSYGVLYNPKFEASNINTE